MTITRRITAVVSCDESDCVSVIELMHVAQFDTGQRGAGDKSAGPTVRSIRARGRELGWVMGGPHSMDVCTLHGKKKPPYDDPRRRGGPTMTTSTTTNEHWCSFERQELDEFPWRRVTRAVCRCGWASEWLFVPARATEAGLAHTANPVVIGE